MILLTKAASREAKKCHVTEEALRDAVLRARRGSIDARLAASLIKQEIPRPPEGRKTACRAIIAYKTDETRPVIIHVYAKSSKSNLSPRETETFTELATHLVTLSDDQIRTLIRDRGWKDIG